MSLSNSLGLLGRKVGMMRLFTDDGDAVPVTVVDVSNNRVTQVKTQENDGYVALQVTFGARKASRVTKPEAGHLEKYGAAPARVLREFKLDDAMSMEPGQVVKADTFEAGDKVDISGKSKGKGYQGVIKRHGQHRGPMAHGSKYHRSPGSMGASAYPSRVPKGKKLPGQMGNKNVTALNLEVVDVDPDENILLIKGAVPGPRGSVVVVKSSVKS